MLSQSLRSDTTRRARRILVVANCLEDKAVDQMREVVTRVLEVQA